MFSVDPGPVRLRAAAAGAVGAVVSMRWLRVGRLWVGLCGARCSPLLPQFQEMLKDVSKGKPLAVIPSVGSQVRGRGLDSVHSMGL